MAALAGALLLDAPVAAETMRRVRSDVEMLHQCLDEAGYRFHMPSRAHVPPDHNITAHLNDFEHRHGPLPLSLRAFYEIVGTVDFRQSWDQLVTWFAREQREAPTGPIDA